MHLSLIAYGGVTTYFHHKFPHTSLSAGARASDSDYIITSDHRFAY